MAARSLPVQAAVGCCRWGCGRWGGGEAAVGSAAQPPAALMDRPVMARQTRARLARSVGRHGPSAADDELGTRPGGGHSRGRPSRGRRWPGRLVGRPGRLGWSGRAPGLGRGPGQDRGEPGRRGPQPGRHPPWSWPSVAAVVAGVVVGAGGLAGDQDPGDRAVTGQPATRLRCQRSGVGVAARGPRGARAGCPGPR